MAQPLLRPVRDVAGPDHLRRRHCGWGEALAPVAPEVVKAIVDRLLRPVLIGEDPRRVRPLWTKLSGLMRERGHLVGHQADALAAVDIALWDVAGKTYGATRARSSGRRVPRRDPDLRLRAAQAHRHRTRRAGRAVGFAKGVRAIKLHLGYGVDEDLATFDAVAAAHPELKVAVDAHWAYDLADALRLGRGLDERGAWFLEAPLAPEDIAAHRELAAALTTPIAVGEALRNRYEFREWIAARAVDLCQPDVGRTGITEAMAIAALAAAHHVPVAPAPLGRPRRRRRGRPARQRRHREHALLRVPARHHDGRQPHPHPGRWPAAR